MKIVLRIGGSVLGSPPKASVVAAYANSINRILKAGHSIAVITGGGGVAREYIETAKSLGLPRDAQDTVAIHTSRLNAKLIGYKLGSPSVSATVDGMVSRLTKNRVAVMGGLRPGITTDTVAALVAEAWHADLIIKASDQDGIYTADPRRHKGARMLHTISFTQLAEILGGEHTPGIHSIVDPVATLRIAKHKMRLVVVNGSDPENILKVISGENVGTSVS